HKTQPVAAVADIVGFQPAQESFLEAYSTAHLFWSEARQPGGVLSRDHRNALKTGSGYGQKRSPLNLAGIHQIEHLDLQRFKEPVHRFQAQSAAGVEEIGEMALLEAGLP